MEYGKRSCEGADTQKEVSFLTFVVSSDEIRKKIVQVQNLTTLNSNFEIEAEFTLKFEFD